MSGDAVSAFVEVLFVRHAQSVANAGGRTADPTSIALTPLGLQQASKFANAVSTTPLLVVQSSFLRAQQTAAPLLAKFANVRCETWPIEEFTYLSPERFANTTMEERRPQVQRYWDEANIDAVDGPGAESLRQFFQRVQGTLERLQQHSARSIVVVGHGQFMQTMLYLLNGGALPTTREQVHRYRAFVQSIPLRNTAHLALEWRGRWWWTQPEQKHLEEHEWTY